MKPADDREGRKIDKEGADTAAFWTSVVIIGVAILGVDYFFGSEKYTSVVGTIQQAVGDFQEAQERERIAQEKAQEKAQKKREELYRLKARMDNLCDSRHIFRRDYKSIKKKCLDAQNRYYCKAWGAGEGGSHFCSQI